MTTATAARQHVAHVLDETGDTKHIWNPDDPEEVAEMRALFDKYKAKGNYLIYRAKRGGEKGEVMQKFDPEAERMIISKAIVAG